MENNLIIKTLDDEGGEITYNITDTSINDDKGEPIVTVDQLTEKGYKFNDDKSAILDAEGKTIELNDNFFSTFKDDIGTTDDQLINIDGTDYKLNKDGDAIKDDGTVHLTKDQIEALSKTINIDDVDYQLDDNGNALNKDNSVFMTKEEIEAAQADVPSVNIADIQEKTGIVVYDSDNKPVVFEDTPEGIASYNKAVFELGKNEGLGMKETPLFQKYPILNQVVSHLDHNNGSLDNFNRRVDFKDVTIKDDDKDTQRNIVIESFLLKGETPEQSKQLLKYIEDDGKLLDKAKSDLEYIQQHYSAIDKQNAASREKSVNDALATEKTFWGVEVGTDGNLKPTGSPDSIYNKVVEKGELKIGDNVYKIPAVLQRTIEGKVVNSTPKDLFDYIYTVKNYNIDNNIVSMTGFDYDQHMSEHSKTKDDNIMEALSMFVGKDMSSIIQQKINDTTVKQVRKVITTKKNTNVTHKPKIKEPIVPFGNI